MLIRKTMLLLSLMCIFAVRAQQATSFVLTEFPIIAVSGQNDVIVKWTGASSDPTIMLQPESERYPDSATLYFGKNPGGGELDNYTDSVTVFVADSSFVGMNADGDSLFSVNYQNSVPVSGLPPERKIVFRPSEQKNMSSGLYYYIVACRATVAGKDTLFYSNELKMIVETDEATVLNNPGIDEKVTNLTPVFSWEKNPGVPYYHIILSDEKISADLENQSIEGLSVVWQAITPNTQITYGAPDPSGTLTADPPPMSPGQTYSWVVLNNYGNHPAYTSKRVGLPRNFTIVGDSLKSPVSVSPASSDTIDATALNAEQVEFAWTNLDSAANTYKLYIYVAQNYEDIEAQMVVWENEYTAGSFDGDTARIHVNLKDILTNNLYTWKVVAVDDKGAGKSGKTRKFVYRGIPTGVMKVKTREQISVSGSVIEKDVAAAKIEVEVLEGSMEAPLLFYTDTHGNLTRQRPAGQYRITAVKEGFESASRTVTISENDTNLTVFYLKRPDATVYGKVIDEAGKPINLAKVYGVSDRGDTVLTEADAIGNFVMNCYQADWSIRAEKTGYIKTIPKDTAVFYAQNVNFGSLVLKRNRYVLSGVVQNSSSVALIGAKVQLLRNGSMLDQIPSTSQEGTFSFSVEPGTYTLTAEKTGFVSYRKTIDVVGSRQVTLPMAAGAALIKGQIFGQTWGTAQKLYAPITSASITLIDTTVNPPESIQTMSDAVYGDFSISVSGNKSYVMISQADGYIAHQRETDIYAEPGKTHILADTLKGLARVNGRVRVSDSQTDMAKVAVVLIDTATQKRKAASLSDATGLFEMDGLPDGEYRISAGKEGFVADSIMLIDTSGNFLHHTILTIRDGRAALVMDQQQHIIQSILVCVEPGEKTIAWHVRAGEEVNTDVSIKIQSPLQSTIRADDTLQGVGPGTYVMTVDADDPSVIDLATHRFTIALDEEDAVVTDSINMAVTHAAKDTMAVEDGKITVTLVSHAELTDVTLFFKDHTEQVFDSLQADSMQQREQQFVYWFSAAPHKNGSMMEYYFRAREGNDTYGYRQEVFRTYIRPDTQTLSRIIVEPSGEDTLLLPSDAKITFTLKGYYGSQFISDENLNGAAVRWSLKNAGKCRISNGSGQQTVLETGADATDIIHLVATVDTSLQRVGASVSESVIVPFRVSGQRLDSIVVKRVDSENEFVTTDALTRAEFTATGIDNNGGAVTISPHWSIWPENAGTIANGVFVPQKNFSGRVQIIARVNNVMGMYNQREGKNVNRSGLLVRYAIPLSQDSVTNGQGCTVFLPDTIVLPPNEGELQIEVSLLDNRVQRNTGNFNVIGDAYDIDEINDIAFNIGDDSITISLSVPEGYQNDARDGKGTFVIGRWHDDSLKWNLLTGSRLSDDGRTISAYTSHFSRYAVLHQVDELKGIISLKPNPFSPYIHPAHEYSAQYGNDVPAGVCFEITPVAQIEPLTVKVDVYSMTGTRILRTKLPNPEREKTYHVWWDGKTVHRDRVTMKTIGDGRYQLQGDEMCRNGRYFVVVTIEDGAGKEKQYMKPVVLFK